MANKLDIAKNSLMAVAQAVKWGVEREDAGRGWDEGVPYLTGAEKAIVALGCLWPTKLRWLVREVSALNWGENIFDKTFPKELNPGQFHSNETTVDLNRNPVQAMGWDDKKRMVNEGVSAGLDKDLIEYGFERRADRRGIDLEFFFWSEVPVKKDVHDGDAATLLTE